ncbi:MAG: NnrS family protein [Desulfitobacterium sp.]|nr:NnrS family protein [Desulfitobacterium sp.]
MNNSKGKIGAIVIWLLFIVISYYFLLVPINIQSPAFWAYLIIVLAVGAGLFLLNQLFIERQIAIRGQVATYLIAVTLLLTLVGGIMFLYSSPIFHAKKYASLIEKQEGDFATDVSEISWNQIPTVDRATAMRLGDRKMGEIVELVSQFNVAPHYTQINYRGKPVRVSPLEYADLIKWFRNTKEGLPHYILVDMVNGAVDLVTPPENIKYSESEYFFENVRRYLRMQYPTAMFGEFSFEIDEEGVPYWVVPVREHTIGLFGGPDSKEVILLNASTGEHQKIKVGEVPEWIDQVYEADLIMAQLNYNGRYTNGFINSILGQQGVLATTEGYNYLAINDDVYVYTGITSVVRDESNIGFILVNMRTKEATFYATPSAEEYSAMESARGAVQEKRYTTTFPILLNIEGKPTYFMSLKDAAGLIKMYALVDAEDYQKVTTGETVQETVRKFTNQAPVSEEESSGLDERERFPLEGKLVDIQSVVISGNTYFYMLLDGEDDVFRANIKVSEKLPFLKIGDEIRGEYVEEFQGVKGIVSLE